MCNSFQISVVLYTYYIAYNIIFLYNIVLIFIFLIEIGIDLTLVVPLDEIYCNQYER